MNRALRGGYELTRSFCRDFEAVVKREGHCVICGAITPPCSHRLFVRGLVSAGEQVMVADDEQKPPDA